MGRPLRIDIPGLVYHVFNRGVKKLPIFNDDDDRQYFIRQFLKTREKYGIEIEQFALMPNHFHLLMRLHTGSISNAMKFALSRYARRFNLKNNIAGHAFQGRFGSIPVQEDRYYTVVSRYIHLNPVKAGIVKRPEEYPWSNYGNLLLGRRDVLATGGMILNYFGRDEASQRQGYQRFVNDGIREDPPIEEGTLLKMRGWGTIPNRSTI